METGGPSGYAAVAWHRAASARERAARAEAQAERQEALAARTGSVVHAQIAASHRRSAACHRSSAELQEAYARRLAAQRRPEEPPPPFMGVVADACGTDSAALTLIGSDQSQLAVAASDHASRAAQDLEYILGEGPCRDAAAGRRRIAASGRDIEQLWPCYGPSVTALGFGEVIAVPLETPDGCLGSLAVFDPRPGTATAAVFTEITEALVRTVLLGPDADPELYGGTDHRDTVHQAAGMVSVQHHCPVGDALALIKAKAYADGVPVNEMALRIVRGEFRLA
ncbi:GAF domain-containing protein [Streptomyces sp. Ru73]|uniref:ANTAR domain-containing protein n=1 Tax=Streptomyces sp. Ru73 TaxID=2080748 RepID=UPI000CDD5048|nr:ANTAR domain-containing protein [Streptomyces sp. Ru73]POX37559.1 GAF domain-containing protein [Streptomyces sp. Ru73]